MDSNSTLPPIQDDTSAGQPVQLPSLPGDPALEAAAAQYAAQISVPSANDLEADDVDLIEKQWVLKAKNIVESTSGDPFLQNKELNKIRADYIKKRYNKDIKLSGD